ncbi:MAG: TIGR02452 family protein [Treponema sp.]|nr:TIGR02452 family protein [Treponema sp.]
MNKNLEIIFQDTQKFYTSNEYLLEAGKKSKENQKCYKAGEKIDCDKNRFEAEGKIIISTKRTFEAAENYSKEGKKVAVLNFANAFNPGGGVLYGSRAQEESLCRISNLYDCITDPQMIKEFYTPHRNSLDDLANDDAIYSPDIIVFKSDVSLPNMRPQEEWFKADVITCAAPCIDFNEKNVTVRQLVDLHESRARQILNIALVNKIDVLILGAFGCGAFRNPPEIVAKVYKAVLKEYLHSFEIIEFAIYCPDKQARNFSVFNNIFAEN